MRARDAAGPRVRARLDSEHLRGYRVVEAEDLLAVRELRLDLHVALREVGRAARRQVHLREHELGADRRHVPRPAAALAHLQIQRDVQVLARFFEGGREVAAAVVVGVEAGERVVRAGGDTRARAALARRPHRPLRGLVQHLELLVALSEHAEADGEELEYGARGVGGAAGGDAHQQLRERQLAQARQVRLQQVVARQKYRRMILGRDDGKRGRLEEPSEVNVVVVGDV